MADAQAQIGVTGLAVMGANLARNIARRGTPTAVHNRTTAKMTEFIKEYGDEGPFSSTLIHQRLRLPRAPMALSRRR